MMLVIVLASRNLVIDPTVSAVDLKRDPHQCILESSGHMSRFNRAIEPGADIVRKHLGLPSNVGSTNDQLQELPVVSWRVSVSVGRYCHREILPPRFYPGKGV